MSPATSSFGSSITSFLNGGNSSNLPDLPSNIPQPPVFGSGSSPGSKPKAKSAQATFIPNASPSVANAGYKSLIGQ